MGWVVSARVGARVLALLMALAGAAVLAAPKVKLREGLWRIDIEMTLPGKGPQGGGPIFREMCLTAANLTQVVMPQNPFCQGRITQQDASSMDWKMQCSQGGTDAHSRAHFEFVGEKFAGAILTTAPRYNMEFKTVIRGKYLGACVKGPAGDTSSSGRLPGTAESNLPPPPPLKPYSP